MKNDPPCHHCQERYLGCQGKCQRYLDYRAFRDAELEKRHKLNQTISDIFAIRRDNMRKKRGHL